VKEPDFYGVVEVSTAKAILFMPRLPEEFAVWMGRLLSQDEFKKMYSVDEVHYVDDVSRTVHYVIHAFIAESRHFEMCVHCIIVV
jgi:Xaa-Pro dipeptidase